MNTQISRRDFLSGTAGLTFAFAACRPDPLDFIGEARARRRPYAPNVWLTIATDGTITIVSPAAEMGQGTFTTLPAIIADELDADWAKVRADPAAGVGGEEIRQSRATTAHFQTSASCVGAGLFQAAAHRRRAGAARAARCRRGALERAGRRACDRAERGRAQGVGPAHELWRDRRLRQGAGRAAARSTDKDLKSPASFRYIGKDVPRVERAVQGHRRREIRHGRAGAGHALRGGAAIAVSGRRAADGRRCRARASCRASPTSCGCRTASASSALRVEATQAAKKLLKVTWSKAPGARPRQRARARGVRRDRARQEPQRRALRVRGRRQGRDDRAPRACSAANIARATSTTPRWSR